MTLNRLSVYLRCLRRLQVEGVSRVSSNELAQRFHLSSSQIRKDLAAFGEFGIRGVGYEVEALANHLRSLLGLDRTHRVVVVGAGNLGTALSQFPGLQRETFRIVGLFDTSPEKIGKTIGGYLVRRLEELHQVVAETEARLGILTVPAQVAQESYDLLADAGITAVLNFAPAQIKPIRGTSLRSVDIRVILEELAHHAVSQSLEK